MICSGPFYSLLCNAVGFIKLTMCKLEKNV